MDVLRLDYRMKGTLIALSCCKAALHNGKQDIHYLKQWSSGCLDLGVGELTHREVMSRNVF